MDVVVTESVKVPNAVLVSGLCESDEKGEIFEFLEKHGYISRVIRVPSTDKELQNSVIVEFESASAVQSLESQLPCYRQCPDNPDIVHYLRLLSSVYTEYAATAVTQSYLRSLKDISRLSGQDMETVLRDELSRIQRSVGDASPSPLAKPETSRNPAKGVDPAAACDPPLVSLDDPNPLRRIQIAKSAPEISLSPSVESSPHPPKVIYQQLPEPFTNPEVQKVIVEHVVRTNEAASSYHSLRIRPFSGRNPTPNHEVDYETWRNQVELMLSDPAVSPRQVIRKIHESLVPLAATLVKHLGPDSDMMSYLNLLDSAYGTVEDGDELFAKFLGTHQDPGKKPSSYLSRLQIALGVVLRRNGIPASDFDRQLLKQFCRGCWNNSLIASLQLEQKKDNPPSFSDLLLLLRTEEDKQAATSIRMKQYLGMSKTKALSASHHVHDYGLTELGEPGYSSGSPSVDANEMKKEIAQLRSQLASLGKCKGSTAQTFKKSKPNETKYNAESKEKPKTIAADKSCSKRPKPGYCFSCGEDGHLASSCSNEPNPALVQEKREELREKQRAWDKQNSSQGTSHLNRE
nr:uncharacterized protein LOC111832821 [Paramormyrops kingsleyae]